MKTFVQEPVCESSECKILSKRLGVLAVCINLQLSVISSLMKGHHVILIFDRSGFMTLATGDTKRIKRSGPRTEPWVHPCILLCWVRMTRRL